MLTFLRSGLDFSDLAVGNVTIIQLILEESIPLSYLEHDHLDPV
jgi:hypothetical protein